MDEYAADDQDYADEIVEETFEEELPIEEVSEAQKSEVADLAKLLRLHSEIWIPYEEQVQEKLPIIAPGSDALPTTTTSQNRDLSSLDVNHVTYPFVTNYEKTKCISFRASQLNNGAKPYIVVPEGVTDSYLIAKMEFEGKRLPFILKRTLPNGNFEAWRLADLMILP